MSIYRVKDWNQHFENNRTRELKRLDWVPVPNKHDGDGYTTLVDRENGAALLGAWLVILQIASKCDTRGTLLRDAATPHTPHSLARISRLPAVIFEEAIKVLIDECKWLEVIHLENPAPSCDIPAPSCGKVPMEGKGMELKGREGKDGALAFSESPSWKEFWEYCQSLQCGLTSEAYAKDKFLAAGQDNWKGKPNWRQYANRCKVWWESDGRPNGNKKTTNGAKQHRLRDMTPTDE